MPFTTPSAADKQILHSNHHHYHPLHDVYILNNEGCQYLQEGNRHQAMTSFKAAFVTVKAVLIAYGGTVTTTTTDPQEPYPRPLLPMSAHVLRTHFSTRMEDEEDVTTTTISSPTRRRRKDDYQYFTFTNGIPCIPGHHFSTDLLQEGQMVSAIVLFNLATTTHLQATLWGDHQGNQYQQHHQQALRSAQSLYFCAFHLVGPLLCQQDHLMGHTRHERNAAFDLLSLALFNNIAVTHWECREFLLADEAFARLAMISHSAHGSFFISTSASDSPQPPPQPQNLDETLLFKVKRMLFNATVGGPSLVSIAPAA